MQEIIYYDLFHKITSRAKTRFFVALDKKPWRAKKVPLDQVCSLWAQPLLVLAFQILGASQLPHRPSLLLLLAVQLQLLPAGGWSVFISAAGLSVS